MKRNKKMNGLISTTDEHLTNEEIERIEFFRKEVEKVPARIILIGTQKLIRLCNNFEKIEVLLNLINNQININCYSFLIDRDELEQKNITNYF